MGRILTATLLDGKEKGTVITNEDYSTVLPANMFHGMGYYVNAGTPSELPREGNAADVCRMLVSGTATSYDPDKFQLDRAYLDVMTDDYKYIASKMPLVLTEPVVRRPNEMLDQERCEVMRVLAQIANRSQMVTQMLMARDYVSTFCYSWQLWAQTLNQRNEMWGRKMIADGGSSETLRLRHTENSVISYGLQQLSYQLEHNRFFRAGGGVETTASPNGTAATSWLGLPTQSSTAQPNPTSLVLGLQGGGTDSASVTSIPYLPLPQLQTMQSSGGAGPTVPAAATAATGPASGSEMQRVALNINVHQQPQQQQQRQPRFQQWQQLPPNDNQQPQYQQQLQEQQLFGWKGKKNYDKNKRGKGGGGGQGSGY
jgi:hypothetical protein